MMAFYNNIEMYKIFKNEVEKKEGKKIRKEIENVIINNKKMN